MTLYTLAPGITRDLPPAIPPSHLWGPVDRGEEPRAIVTVQVAMTRDMLALALDHAVTNAYDALDTWTVAYIREGVEMALSMEGPWRIEQDAHSFPDLLDDPAARTNVQAVYRAVDRAFPLYAPKES
ncbi:hypothetical protein ABT034_34555 [Streptomyces sp. NPDC002773]|uniref:hypothetical protein n=1 Tax=Streptomyces sp. NPDC002773 TaxID=3154430 RepID=UPI00331F2A78